MAFTADSTFDRPRLFSSTTPVHETLPVPCNFITFLAAAQKLGVSFLPITWQPKRPSLGEGGTSQIGQALMNLQTSLAFKRVSDRDKLETPKEEILRRCINEMTILWHPAVRSHPNVLELQGICWDVSPKTQEGAEATPPPSSDDETVWPVLVFEKSHFEDLYHFARLPVGRELGMTDRLKICLQIGEAIAHMQSNNIVHGDVKPQNVLVFRADDGSFTAKVADFGFSTRYAQDDTRIVLHWSRPWRAPEFDEYHEFTPVQALKTDVFSFGLLCLWFLFEKSLSGILPLPRAAQLESLSHAYKGEEQAFELLDDLKKTDSLVRFANQLVIAEAGFNDETKDMLQNYFSGCLVSDPTVRDVDMQHSLKHMNIHPTQSAVQALVEIPSLSGDSFKLFNSIRSFYNSDYRLRSYIRRQLEEVVTDYPTNNLHNQLAFCYQLGFGCPGDDELHTSIVYDIEEARVQIETAMESEPEEEYGRLYNSLTALGQHEHIAFADYYGENKVLEIAERTTRKDIERTTRILGAKNSIVLLLEGILSSILLYQGRWEEAKELEMKVLEVKERILGQEHPDTLISMGNLARTYSGLGQWEEAKKLEMKVLKVRERILGQEHPDTLLSMGDLARTYSDLGQWEEAKKLEMKVLEVSERILGQEHPDTLISMGNLASTYSDLGQWEEAKKLEIKVLEVRERILGQEHPATLRSMGDLARTYSDLGQWEEAKNLLASCVTLSIRFLGPNHPNTRGRIEVLDTWGQTQNS